ncbi:MAG: flagellar assembly protein A [Campylobacterales bacterium]
MGFFEEIVKECGNIAQEIQRVATSKNVETSSLEFELLQVFLYIKTDEKEPFVEVNSELEKKFSDSDFMLSDKVIIEQRYSVKIFPKEYLKLPAIVKLMANSEASKVVAKVQVQKEGDPTLLINDIYNEIRRKKAYFGILVDALNEGLHKKIEDAVRSSEKLFEVECCNSFAPKHSIDGHMKFATEEIEKGFEGEKVNFIALKSGERIGTFFKKKLGEPGRNCKGEFIAPKEPEGDDAPPISVGENIEVKEEDDKIEYIAQKNGYLICENSQLSIKSELNLESLNLSQTGSIIAGIDSGTTLVISNANDESEAIGDGISVEVETLKVEGNIGKAVKIKAKKVEIVGLTHQSSVIEANEADIKILKGYLKAKDCKIERVEGGVVYGESVEVAGILGGGLNGRVVRVGDVYSNSHIAASEKITINTLKGEDNHFRLDARAYYIQSDDIEALMIEKKSVQKKIVKYKQEMKQKSSFLKTSIKMAKELKQEIGDIKKKGGQIPKVLKEKMIEYGHFITNARNLNTRIKELTQRYQDIEKELVVYDSKIKDAKIENDNSWTGYNEVKFNLLLKNIDLTYKPRVSDKEIVLDEDLDGKPYIRGVYK